MTQWTHAFAGALWSGTVASLASTWTLARRGSAECADAAAPLNGPSQWIWGRHAALRRGFSVKHTVTGLVIHHAMSILWATLFERMRGDAGEARAARTVAAAITTSVAACLVDYRVAPERLTPGFERRLSRRSLFATYATFALALAAAALVVRK